MKTQLQPTFLRNYQPTPLHPKVRYLPKYLPDWVIRSLQETTVYRDSNCAIDRVDGKIYRIWNERALSWLTQ